MNLLTARCTARPEALAVESLPEWLTQVPGWSWVDDVSGAIACRFVFANFYQTMAFVNAVAEIAHAQDHHPDMHIGYDACSLRYGTHSAQGLTMNDFICAAQVSSLPESTAG